MMEMYVQEVTSLLYLSRLAIEKRDVVLSLAAGGVFRRASQEGGTMDKLLHTSTIVEWFTPLWAGT